jgi:hypothetical protein
MAKVTTYYIIQGEGNAQQFSEEQLENWIDKNHPDKVFIGGEDGTSLIVNEEDTALMCMEYTE